MIRPLRRAHRIAWWVLAPAVATLLWLALHDRPSAPVVEGLPDALQALPKGR